AHGHRVPRHAGPGTVVRRELGGIVPGRVELCVRGAGPVSILLRERPGRRGLDPVGPACDRPLVATGAASGRGRIGRGPGASTAGWRPRGGLCDGGVWGGLCPRPGDPRRGSKCGSPPPAPTLSREGRRGPRPLPRSLSPTDEGGVCRSCDDHTAHPPLRPGSPRPFLPRPV